MTDIDPIEYGTYIERVDNLVKRVDDLASHPMLTADVAKWAVESQERAAKIAAHDADKKATRSQLFRTVLIAPVGALAGTGGTLLIQHVLPHLHL